MSCRTPIRYLNVSGRQLLLGQNAESGVRFCMDTRDVGQSEGDIPRIQWSQT